MMNRFFQFTLLSALVVTLLACQPASDTDSDTNNNNNAADSITINGVSSKGPISAASIAIIQFDAADGSETVNTLASTTTDSNGNWQVSIPAASHTQALLIKSSGGSFLDESDPNPVASAKRRITLATDEVLLGVLFPGQNTASVTMLTHALIEKARIEASVSGNFHNVLDNNRQLATNALGFDPFTVTATNPLTPASSASVESIQYAMYLGGLASALNSAAIQLTIPVPDYTLIDALIRDLTDGDLDGSNQSGPVMLDVGNGNVAFPDNINLNQAILRFRNNNYSAYAQTSVSTPLQVNEAILVQSGSNSFPVAADDIALTAVNTTISISNVLNNDGDADGDNLTTSLLTQASNGTVTAPANGIFSYTPNTGFSGSDSFTYQISDGRGGSDSATVIINVQGTVVITTQPPLANAGSDQTVNELSSVTLSGSATDSDGSIASYSWSQVSGISVALSNAGSATSTFNTPVVSAGNVEVLVFQLTATDDSGATGVDFVTIIAQPVLIPPVALAGADQTLNELLPVTLDATASSDDRSIVSYAWVQTAGFPAISLTGANSATASFTGPDIANDTTFSFQVTVTDDEGGVSSDVVDINLLSLNTGPTLVDDPSQVAVEDTSVQLTTLLNNDTDPESDSITINTVTQPANGSVVIDSGNTSVTYTPDPNFNGIDSFTYSAVDQFGGLSTNSATVTIVVSGVNDNPVANTDTASVTQGFSVQLSNLLTNDTDPEGNTLSITGVTQPANGVSINNGDGTVSYTPDLAFNGTDTFTYSIVDGNGGSSTGLINISVIADSDGDGIIDSDESTYSTSPTMADSDTDGFTDSHEVLVGTNPNLNTDFPSTTIISSALGNAQIATDTTWGLINSPYLLKNNVNIQNGATLTIEPGVVVKAENSISIQVNSGGILNAQGNAPLPQHVVFTSDNDDSINGDTNSDGVATAAAAGDWAGISFNQGSDGTTRHASLKNAAHCLSIANSSPVIDHMDVGDCSGYGIYVQTSVATQTANLSNISILDYDSNGTSTGNWGIYIYGTSSATSILNLSNISLDKPGSSISYGGVYIYANGAFINGSIDQLNITSPKSDGIHIWNSSSNSIDIALSNLTVTGAAANSVEIRKTSSGNLLTQFDGSNIITNNANTQAAISVENNAPDFLATGTFTINNAGYGLNLINSSGNYNNINLNNTAIAGIRLAGGSNPAEFSNIVLTNALTPYELVGQNLTSTIISGYDFSDASVNKSYILLNGSLLANMTLGVDPLLTGSSVWRVNENVTIPAGITLTVTDDAVVKFDLGKLIYVDGSFLVTSAGGGPALFTSIRDDSVGDDLGDPTNAARGDWSRIDVRTGGTISMDNAIIRYAAYGLYSSNASPALFNVANTTVSEFSYYGMYLYPNGNVTYSLTNNTISNGSSYDGFYLYGTTGDAITLVIDGLTIDSVGANTSYRAMLLDINGDATLTGSISNVTISNASGAGIYLDDASTGSVDPLFDTVTINSTVGTYGIQLIGNASTQPTLNNISVNTGIYNLTLEGVGGSYSNMTLSGASAASVFISGQASPVTWDSATIVLNSAPSPYHLSSPLPASIGTFSTGNTTDLGFAASSTVAVNYVEVAGSISNMTLMKDPLSTTSSVWRVPANLTIPAGVTLTVTEDAVLKFDANIILYVDGTLSVPDGAGGPAIFTSILDDSVGDDLGNPLPAVRGSWNRIDFRANSSIDINDAIIRYMSYGIYSSNANPVSFNVSNTTITEFLYYGMHLYPNGSVTYNLNNDTISNGSSYEGLYIYGTTGDAITLAIDGLTVNSVGANTSYRGILLSLDGNATLGGTLNNITIGATSGSGIYLDDRSTGAVNPTFSAITINGPVGVNGMDLSGNSTTAPVLSNVNINAGNYNLSLQGVAGTYDNINLDGATVASMYFSADTTPTSADWTSVTLSNAPSPLQLVAMDIPSGFSYSPGAGLNESYLILSGTLSSNLTLYPDPLGIATGTGNALDPTTSYWYSPTTLTVGNGATLTLNANTLMKFAETSYLQVSSGGSLNVLGSAGNEVYLTSFSDNAVGDAASSAALANDWYGVYFRTGSNGGTLSYLQSWYAYYGVYFENVTANPAFTNLTVSYPLYGLYLNASTAIAPTFNGVSIVEASNDGVYFANTGFIAPVFSGTLEITGSAISYDCIHNVSSSPNINISGWTLDGCQNGIEIQGPGTYTNNIIRNAYASGLYISTSSAITVGNNRIVNNGTSGSTYGGGIRLLNIGANSVIENNLIRHNKAYLGGGIYSQGGSINATIRNNLIVQNHATTDTGGVYIYSNSTLSLLNNTIADNTVDGISDVGAGLKIPDITNNVSYSNNLFVDNQDADSIENLQDLSAGSVENFNLENAASANGLGGANSWINTDPLFTQGWYLGLTSPAIDQGSDVAANLGLSSLTTQADGITDSGTVDIGYHYTAAAPAISATSSTVIPSTITLGFSQTASLTVTPRDALGNVLGAGLDLQVAASNFPGNLGRIVDQGDGIYLVDYTSGTTTGSDSLVFTVNGVVTLSTQASISW